MLFISNNANRGGGVYSYLDCVISFGERRFVAFFKNNASADGGTI